MHHTFGVSAVNESIGVTQLMNGLLLESMKCFHRIGWKTVDLIFQALDGNHRRPSGELSFPEHIREDRNEEIHPCNTQNPGPLWTGLLQKSLEKLGGMVLSACGVKSILRIKPRSPKMNGSSESFRETLRQGIQKVRPKSQVDRHDTQYDHKLFTETVFLDLVVQCDPIDSQGLGSLSDIPPRPLEDSLDMDFFHIGQTVPFRLFGAGFHLER